MIKGLFKNELGAVRHAAWEYVLARTGLGLVLLEATWSLHKANNEPGLRHAHGLASLGARGDDLGWLGDFIVWFNTAPGVPGAWFLIFAVLTAWYVVGVAPLITTFFLFAMHTFAGTFFMSQGAAHHTQQIVGLTLFGQVLASAWTMIRDRDLKTLVWADSGRHRDCSMFFCQQMIAASYVITGLTKLERSDGKWISEAPNLVVQFEKNYQMAYYNELIPPDDRTGQIVSSFLTNFPVLGMIAFGSVLLLEFLAFLALFNRSILAIWGLALIGMHVGISFVMKLNFVYNEALLLIFFVNIPYWIGVVLSRIRRLSPSRVRT